MLKSSRITAGRLGRRASTSSAASPLDAAAVGKPSSSRTSVTNATMSRSASTTNTQPVPLRSTFDAAPTRSSLYMGAYGDTAGIVTVDGLVKALVGSMHEET